MIAPNARKPKRTIEFGDFQTPIELANDACHVLARQGLRPSSLVEPTCGTGSFLIAGLRQFDKVKEAIGVDISPSYVEAATSELQRNVPYASKTRVICGNFFDTDWPQLLRELSDPLLVVGNPPWVTNAALGSLGSSNLPPKTNFQNRSGFDAMTGKSNFDISEWMLLRMLDWIDGRNATMAMLCKTVVARKVLMHAWKNRISLDSANMYLVDAARYFDASVDACFLVCHSLPSARSDECSLFETFDTETASRTIGFRDGHLIAEVSLFDRWKHLQGEPLYRWRSGIKHDCAKVMELRKEGTLYRNGLGEAVDLEDRYLYPMLKSSDLANGSVDHPRRWMLVTQTKVGADTRDIQRRAPKTWEYLQKHGQLLDRRGSSIYRRSPRFSVFGVGWYSFAPWKVAISGFYKKLEFKAVGNIQEKPIMLDDTSYFIPCETKQEADYIASMLNSPIAREFFEAFVFWDAKRPITVELLRRLDFSLLARELGTEATMTRYLDRYAESQERVNC